MKNLEKRYHDALLFSNGAHFKKDIQGWTTLYKNEQISLNKNSNNKTNIYASDTNNNSDIYQYLEIPKKQIDGASFTGWKNPVNGNDQIYTKEDIARMSKDEITAIWNELSWQARKIGIPSEQDLKDAQVRYGNVIHVNSYVRKSGVHVRDYWRSLR